MSIYEVIKNFDNELCVFGLKAVFRDDYVDFIERNNGFKYEEAERLREQDKLTHHSRIESLTKEQIDLEKKHYFDEEMERIKENESIRLKNDKLKVIDFHYKQIISPTKVCPGRVDYKKHYVDCFTLETPNGSSDSHITWVNSECVFCAKCETIELRSMTKDFWEKFIKDDMKNVGL
jgi:hypothetical protein